MANGVIILLNGTSSSGKTSIAKELQRQLDKPFLHVGVDNFLEMVPEICFGVDPTEDDISSQGIYRKTVNDGNETWYEIHVGQFGHQLMSGMRRAMAALAATGNNLIIDDVILYREWLEDYLLVLQKFEVLFVRVSCPLEVVEEREYERGDRMVGQAKGDFARVHTHQIYDLEVDTSVFSPAQSTQQIIRRLKEGPPPNAFGQLRKMFLAGANAHLDGDD
jgi:chloramphenicol 3-O phosphotransferase